MSMRKSLAVLLAAMAASLPAVAGDLTVTITDVKEASGKLMVAVFREEGWRKDPVATKSVAAESPQTTTVIEGLAPGRYGITLFQDLDMNGELDRNRFGIPKEPYGFSNDAPVRFGPPSFEDAGFDLTEDGATQTITLR